VVLLQAGASALILYEPAKGVKSDSCTKFVQTSVMGLSIDQRLTEQQLELLKSFKYLRNEESINDVRELLSLYYEHKLHAAIDKAEAERAYTREVYETWLKKQKSEDE
jgi:hypothetical protein